MIKGKSDPYVKINIGGETFTSNVIKNNLNPTWNEMYEVIITRRLLKKLNSFVFFFCSQINDNNNLNPAGDSDRTARPGASYRSVWQGRGHEGRLHGKVIFDTFPQTEKKKDLKRWHLISVFVIQVEDKSERHHRISVHWSGENVLT